MKKSSEPIVKEKKKGIQGKFCPKCGSANVFWASGLPQLWSLCQCRECHYRGPVILEDGDLALKLQEQWKRENH